MGFGQADLGLLTQTRTLCRIEGGTLKNYAKAKDRQKRLSQGNWRLWLSGFRGQLFFKVSPNVKGKKKKPETEKEKQAEPKYSNNPSSHWNTQSRLEMVNVAEPILQGNLTIWFFFPCVALL